MRIVYSTSKPNEYRVYHNIPEKIAIVNEADAVREQGGNYKTVADKYSLDPSEIDHFRQWLLERNYPMKPPRHYVRRTDEEILELAADAETVKKAGGSLRDFAESRGMDRTRLHHLLAEARQIVSEKIAGTGN